MGFVEILSFCGCNFSWCWHWRSLPPKMKTRKFLLNDGNVEKIPEPGLMISRGAKMKTQISKMAGPSVNLKILKCIMQLSFARYIANPYPTRSSISAQHASAYVTMETHFSKPFPFESDLVRMNPSHCLRVVEAEQSRQCH